MTSIKQFNSAVIKLTIGCLTCFASEHTLAASMTVDSNGGLEVFELDNTDYWFKISGRLHLDSVIYGDHRDQFPNGSQIRRGKLVFKGGVGDDWVYKFDLDQADSANRSRSTSGGAGIGEAFIGYNGWDTTWIAFGQVGVPSGLESWIGSNDSFFMENSLPDSAFGSDLGLGVFLQWEGKYFTAAGSVAHPRSGTRQTSASLSNDPVSFGGRVTFSPVHDQCKVYHTGLTYRHHNLREFNNFDYSTKPEIRSRQSASLTTNIPANTVTDHEFIDWELAARWGPTVVASEYFYTKVNRNDPINPGDLSFYGYYVMGSYVLTGETRAYDFPSGSFGSVKPRCKKRGAWELSVRHSYIKLLDSVAIQSVAPIGEPGDMVGNAHTTTIGLTWWVNANVRFMANYAHMNYIDLVGQPDVALNAFGLRGQVSW